MNKVKFWDNKIINWEKKRYAAKGSIYARKENTIKLLENLKNEQLIVIEFGCGSGIFAKEWVSDNHQYIGFDFSSEAIKEANKNKKSNMLFLNRDIQSAIAWLIKNNINPDLIISLGLMDWLNDEDRNKLINLKSKYFMHSFSDKNNIIAKLHNIFVYITYAFKTKGYKPRYDTEENIKKMFEFSSVKIYKNKNMNIGIIAHNL